MLRNASTLNALAEEHLSCRKQHSARLLDIAVNVTNRIVGRDVASTMVSASAA
jgi:hypothetical protein